MLLRETDYACSVKFPVRRLSYFIPANTLQRRRPQDRHEQYRPRLLASLAAVLLLMIGFVRFWPVSSPEAPDEITFAKGNETIAIEEIQPTSQQQAPPPPPLPPVPMPDEVELEEEELDLSQAFFDEEPFPGEDPITEEGPAEESSSSAAEPDVEARQASIVEPEYTEDARRQDIRARVVVEVLVNAEGYVDDAQIVERLLLDENNDPKERVSELGYGLEEAALEAARRTTFFPARSGGEPVQSRKVITIRFGV